MQHAASQSLLVSRPSPWARFVGLSVAIHVAVVVGGIAFARFTAAPPLALDQKPIKASLVRLGKKRDEKMLPRKETPPPPPKQVEGTQAPEPTPVAPVKPAVAVPIPNVTPTPETAKKQSGKKEGVEQKSALFNAFDKVAQKAEELEGDPDGDVDGDSAVQEGERYYGLISAQVKRNYDIPSTISEQERMYLKAQLTLRIAASGDLIDVTLRKPSGNDLYDAAVISAVKRTAPFSPPPEPIRKLMASPGVTLNFSI